MRRSAIWRASRRYFAATGGRLRALPAGPRRCSRFISSARTSSISTRCSGRRCSSSPVRRTRCPTRSTCTASSRSRAKRCRSRAAPASAPTVYLDLGLNPEWLRYYLAGEAQREGRGPRFQSRRLHRPRQQRPGGQSTSTSQAAPRMFISKQFDGKLATPAESENDRANRLTTSQMEAEAARVSYEAREYGRVLRDAMRIADRINEAFDAAEPWLLARDASRRDDLQTICSQALQGFQLLTGAPRAGAAGGRVARRARIIRSRPRLRLVRCVEGTRVGAAVSAPDHTHRSEADRSRCSKDRRRPRAHSAPRTLTPSPLRSGRGKLSSASFVARSQSTNSTRSICASRESSTPSTSTAPTNCSSSRSTSATIGRAPCSPASSRRIARKT